MTTIANYDADGKIYHRDYRMADGRMMMIDRIIDGNNVRYEAAIYSGVVAVAHGSGPTAKAANDAAIANDANDDLKNCPF